MSDGASGGGADRWSLYSDLMHTVGESLVVAAAVGLLVTGVLLLLFGGAWVALVPALVTTLVLGILLRRRGAEIRLRLRRGQTLG